MTEGVSEWVLWELSLGAKFGLEESYPFKWNYAYNRHLSHLIYIKTGRLTLGSLIDSIMNTTVPCILVVQQRKKGAEKGGKYAQRGLYL